MKYHLRPILSNAFYTLFFYGAIDSIYAAGKRIHAASEIIMIASGNTDEVTNEKGDIIYFAIGSIRLCFQSHAVFLDGGGATSSFMS